MRFLRFSAGYGEGPLDGPGLDAAIREREGLRQLSRERVRAELMKLAAAPRAGEIVGACSEAGLLGILLGGVATAGASTRLRSSKAPATRRPTPCYASRPLASRSSRTLSDCAIGCASPTPNSSVWRRRRGLWRRFTGSCPATDALRALLFERGRVAARYAISLAHAEAGAPPDDPVFAAAWRFVCEAPGSPVLPFQGADIMARGIAQGRGVGAVLKTLQALWVRAGFPREPEILARLLDEALGAPRE